MTPREHARTKRGGETLRFVRRCLLCDREREIGERYSRAGLCASCADFAMLENRRQLRAHRGPLFNHWRRRCLAAFGVNVEDDELDDEESVA